MLFAKHLDQYSMEVNNVPMISNSSRRTRFLKHYYNKQHFWNAASVARNWSAVQLNKDY